MARRAEHPARTWQTVVTAEHAAHAVPPAWKHLFRGKSEVLCSHRGWDPGTAPLAEAFQQQTRWPVLVAQWSRLLVELNRSKHHPKLFSEFTRDLSPENQNQLLEEYYIPHRQAVQKQIAKSIQLNRPVVHLALHSFTPVLEGVPRRADIGLLFDPRRDGESRFCRQWQAQLRQSQPSWIIRRNYPYLGIADGFTTALRREFSADQYLGIEIEVNQSWFAKGADSKLMIQTVVETFSETLNQFS